MWYVVQVKSGEEEEIILQCKTLIRPDVLKKSYLPYYEEIKRYDGRWNINKKVLFPGYVFLESDGPGKLYQELKKVLGLSKMIGTGHEIVPLPGEEINLLLRLGSDRQVVGVSTGIITDGKISILSGPLKGMERIIHKIDRHKRKAYLHISLSGRQMRAQVALEIVEKS